MPSIPPPPQDALENQASALAHRQFAVAFAAHQDVLLQMYRLQLLAFELCCALIIGVMGWVPFEVAGVQPVLLLLALWAHASVGNPLRVAIGFRGQDVDHAQLHLLAAETCVPVAMRIFTRFKIYQDREPESLAKKERMFLSEDNTATMEDMTSYFFAHKSKSRWVIDKVLRLPARLTQVVGLLGVVHAVL